MGFYSSAIKRQTTQSKMGKTSEQYITKRDIQMPIKTWRDAQYH